MYLDGFEQEELVSRTGEIDSTVVSSEVHRSGGTTITDRKHATQILDGTPGEFAAFGVQEQWIG